MGNEALNKAITAAIRAAACRQAARVDPEQGDLWRGAAEFQREKASGLLAEAVKAFA